MDTAPNLLELPQSTYYDQPVQTDEAELHEAIKDFAGQSSYGTKRILIALKGHPLPSGRGRGVWSKWTSGRQVLRVEK